MLNKSDMDFDELMICGLAGLGNLCMLWLGRGREQHVAVGGTESVCPSLIVSLPTGCGTGAPNLFS